MNTATNTEENSLIKTFNEDFQALKRFDAIVKSKVLTQEQKKKELEELLKSYTRGNLLVIRMRIWEENNLGIEFNQLSLEENINEK